MFHDFLAELDEQAGGKPNTAAFKQAHRQSAMRLAELFHAGRDVEDLVHGRAELVDGLLTRAWFMHLPEAADACLIAVGGYGREELHPASDVDVLILTADDPRRLATQLEPFVTFLWDIGLEVGHSVRSLDQCVAEASSDITVITNLIESRHLCGDEDLYLQMQERTSVEHIWPSDTFYEAKLEEQRKRFDKTHGTSHDLEPNLKTNPGGLRDLQMIGWIAKRHFGATHFHQLVGLNFLTESEYEELKQSELFIWRIRFALHLLTGRHDDRLLFEHQRKLAKQFGYTDDKPNLGVEQFMQEYYRKATRLQRLNEMLSQLFSETILLKNQLGEPRPINRRFQARGNYIEVVNPANFARHPLAMMEMFLLLQQNPELHGVRASTIRSIRAHRHLIDHRLRNSIGARSLFMEMLRQPRGIINELQRMHRYGILGRYIPAFNKITGLMQFDLFHAYTVDEHILMVVRNMRKFTLPEFEEECPLCHTIMQTLPKPELLYLSGLFHDIAKGRGGDHSNKGADDAYQFCQQHHLSEYDSLLVAWLVGMHLVMSNTAQRKDIDDPEVIQAFAAEVGTRERLDYLFLLTVADMRGTNPELWNSWKSALLNRLYHRTVRALQRGLDSPEEEDQVIAKVQEDARTLLRSSRYSEEQINLCWMQLSTDYFLQTPAAAVAWHTSLLLKSADQPDQAQVYTRIDPDRGCCEVFTFGPDRDGLFAASTATLDQLAINILGARIDVSSRNQSVNSYLVLEDDGSMVSPVRCEEIIDCLKDTLNQRGLVDIQVNRRLPRQIKSFVRDTTIGIDQDELHQMTVLTVITHDRPGLLALIAKALGDQHAHLHSALIYTEGALARDRFTLTNQKGQMIEDPEHLDRLRQAVLSQLDG